MGSARLAIRRDSPQLGSGDLPALSSGPLVSRAYRLSRIELTLAPNSSLPAAKAEVAGRSSTQLRLRVDCPPSVPSEIWVLLSRHLTTPSLPEKEHIGLNVVRTWGAGKTTRGPARVDATVSLAAGTAL